MSCRPYLKGDYSLLKAWTADNGAKSPPESWLPAEGGLVFDIDGQPGAIGFVYTTNSKMALLEWVIVNPNLHGKQRDSAIEGLITGMVNYSKDLGVEFLVGSIINPKLLVRGQNHGFEIEAGAVTVTRRLNG